MSTLKETLYKKIEEHRPRTTKLLKDHSDVKLGEVTIGQAIGGARGVRCLVTDISWIPWRASGSEARRFQNASTDG